MPWNLGVVEGGSPVDGVRNIQLFTSLNSTPAKLKVKKDVLNLVRHFDFQMFIICFMLNCWGCTSIISVTSWDAFSRNTIKTSPWHQKPTGPVVVSFRDSEGSKHRKGHLRNGKKAPS